MYDISPQILNELKDIATLQEFSLSNTDVHTSTQTKSTFLFFLQHIIFVKTNTVRGEES